MPVLALRYGLPAVLVLAGFVILGAAGGAAIVWFWDRMGT